MKDSPEANFPIHITISYDSKFDKFAIYVYIYILKYTWKIQSSNTCLFFGYPTIYVEVY